MLNCIKSHKPLSLTIFSYLLILIITLLKLILGGNTSDKWNIGFNEDGNIKMENGTKIESSFSVPEENLTGISFRFTSTVEAFSSEKFKVKIEDVSQDKIIFDSDVLLCDQVYDYQIEEYKIIIPFKFKSNQGDIINITITADGISSESNILIKTSSTSDIVSYLRVNDSVQQDNLVTNIYFENHTVDYPGILMQGLVGILVVTFLYFSYNQLKSHKKEKSVTLVNKKRKKVTFKDFCVFLLFGVIFFLCAEYTYYAGIKNTANVIKEVSSTSETNNAVSVDKKEVLSFEYTAVENFWTGIGLKVNDIPDNKDLVEIKIYKKNEETELLTLNRAIVDIMSTQKDGFVQIYFGEDFDHSLDESYNIKIRFFNNDENGIKSDNNKDNNVLSFIALYRCNAFLKTLYVIIISIIFTFSSIIYWLKKIGIHYCKLCFIAVVFLGIVFELIFTPYTVPDESSHIDTMYRLSNKILMVEDTGISEAIYKREGDVFTDIGDKRFLGAEQYRWLYDTALKKSSNDYVVAFAGNNTNNTSEIFYLPAAIGFSIGRLFNFNFWGAIYFARTLNLLVSAWIIYLAIKKIPFGKSILCALSLLPITLQELASCSYDGPIIAVSFLFISYCIYFMYSDKLIQFSEVAIVLFLSILLASCKGCVYLPLLFLLFIVAIKRGMFTKKVIPCLVLGGVIVILSGASMYATELFSMFSRTQEYAYVAQSGKELYSVEYLLTNPLATFRLIENTFYQNMDYYIETIVGGGLGSLQVSVNKVLQISYIIFIFLSTVCSKKDVIAPNVIQKILLFGIAIMSSGLVLLSMLINWTPFGYGVIDGVQGRYFMPIMPLFLLLFRNTNIRYRNKPYLNLIVAGYFMGVCTLLQVMINLWIV